MSTVLMGPRLQSVGQSFQLPRLLNHYLFVPDLNLSFNVNGQPHKLSLKVPISVNKFMEPTEMNGEAFFSRWKNLST